MAKLKAVLDAAAAHYAGQAAKSLDVPEWGIAGKPLKISWMPWTVAERNKVYRRNEDGSTPDGGVIQVRALIVKARGENGSKLFDEMDEHALTHKVDSDVVGRIANAILYGALPAGTSVEGVVDTEKNG
ncbi:hypothetical protein [Mesorhizobium sp. B1-1-2]|uniref:hypothetical protein n=1 Tax=Mesorhizobium sp. B1-1-2 TaxID=2589982 RepID=UPI00112828A2|nr:hypothetical protein [Mesorhizobium sp. B1-1-2]TPN79963.1 hypothetical protein FJ985_01650 [Mesorhizobium sp. B1-1-2]